MSPQSHPCQHERGQEPDPSRSHALVHQEHSEPCAHFAPSMSTSLSTRERVRARSIQVPCNGASGPQPTLCTLRAIEVSSVTSLSKGVRVRARSFQVSCVGTSRPQPALCTNCAFNFQTDFDAPPLIVEHEEAHAASVACPHMPALLPIKRPAPLSKSPRPPPSKKPEQKGLWSFSFAFCSPTKSPPSGEGNPLRAEPFPSCFTSTSSLSSRTQFTLFCALLCISSSRTASEAGSSITSSPYFA
mmetsp:Transcript_143368/g.267219  ORF Transcript_143368/g.267219 Transcript_143368/m.267219 type:complete len:244 (+) Transcript_143368:205-936(+)